MICLIFFFGILDLWFSHVCRVNKIKNYFCVGNGNQKSDSDNEELEKDSEIVDNENSVSIPSSQSK